MRSLVEVWEKLYIAKRELTEGDGSAAERLWNAYACELARLDSADFPAELVEPYRRIMVQLTNARDFSDASTVAATIISLTEDQLKQVTVDLIGLYNRYTLVCALSRPGMNNHTSEVNRPNPSGLWPLARQ